VEREALSPIDEAAWFFQMLGLKEEQLFIPRYDSPSNANAVESLPTRQNPALKALADNLAGSVTPYLIEERLPLLAMPDSTQIQVGQKDGGIPIEKAYILARLRLIGNKKEAQEQMVAVWRNAIVEETVRRSPYQTAPQMLRCHYASALGRGVLRCTSSGCASRPCIWVLHLSALTLLCCTSVLRHCAMPYGLCDLRTHFFHLSRAISNNPHIWVYQI
jgi:hypothetical protein